MKTKSFLGVCLFCIICIPNYAQNVSDILQQVNQALNEGNCKKASDFYNQYKNQTARNDAELESKINYCYGENCYNEKKYAQAKEWYLVSASQGNPEAEFRLGWLYRKGLGVEQDNDEAIRWYELAAQHGDVDAQYNLGWIYEHVNEYKNYDAALKWYGLAADQGSPYAQTNLGSMYYDGKGVIQDYKKAMKLFLNAADQGVSEAYNYLGSMHFLGKGVERDYNEALKWYNLAAEQQYVPAYYEIGYLYYMGYGDYSEALKWFLRASEHDNMFAPYNLGEMYEYGLGVDKDIEKAKYYYRIASERGNAGTFIHKNWALEEEEQILSEGPRVQWLDMPAIINYAQFVLRAEIKSSSKIEYCKVYLNGVEVQEDNATGGSSIVEDQKGDENHDININRTLVLREGKNTIGIKARNAGGETVEEKTIEYKPDNGVIEKALVVWNDLPANTTERQLELDATVKSTVKDVVCRVLLNGVEIAAPTKGSSIVEDPKEVEHRYVLPIHRTLELQEGNNIIGIEVINMKGETLVSDSKSIKFSLPKEAEIYWEGEYPSKTTKPQLHVKADIESDSEVEYCKIFLNNVEVSATSTKGSNVVMDPQRKIAIEKTLILHKGENVIKIVVKNACEKQKIDKKTVKYYPTEKRLALVIGNANYRTAKNLGRFGELRNPINDAVAIYNLLDSCGFDMMPILKDANYHTMKKAVEDFIVKANNEKYEVAFVYYSGHGVSPIAEIGVDPESYFIPLMQEDSISYIEDLAKYAINANRLIEDLNKRTDCRIKIAMLDCCRSCNLNSRNKGAMTLKGMNPLNVPFGEQIFFAAQYKKEAIDYIKIEDKNSPFVTSFLECFRKYPNDTWEQLVKQVKIRVYEMTGAFQEPKEEGTLKGDFYLNPYHE